MRGQIRICAVTPLGRFRVRLELTDNTTKEVDLEPYLWGPVFEPIRNDPSLFQAVKVDPRLGTIVCGASCTSVRRNVAEAGGRIISAGRRLNLRSLGCMP